MVHRQLLRKYAQVSFDFIEKLSFLLHCECPKLI